MSVKITAFHIRKIYALGHELGLVNKSVEDDELHLLVHRETNKSSIKELTFTEYEKVIKELNRLKKENDITEGQKGLIWAYMYELVELDKSKGKTGVRLVGAIKKILGKEIVTAHNPFSGITRDEGKILIEQLKRYVKTEKAKYNK